MGVLAGLAWGRQVGDWLAEFVNWPAGGGPAGWLAGWFAGSLRGWVAAGSPGSWIAALGGWVSGCMW